MTSLNARATGTAVVAGLGALVYFHQGLYFWTALLGWAAFVEAGGDGAALKKAVAGTSFGAFMAWAAIVVSLLIPIPDGWWWVPRIAATIAIALYILVIATRTEMLSRLFAGMVGFAALISAAALAVETTVGLGRYTGLHHSNPLVGAIVGMIGGALLGFVAHRLSGALETK